MRNFRARSSVKCSEAEAELERIHRLAPAISQMNRGPLLGFLVARQQETSSANALLIGINSRWYSIRLQSRGRVIQHAARHHDRAVGRQQLLSLEVLYRSHAFLQGRVLNRKTQHAAVSALFFLKLSIDQVVVVFIGLGTKGAGLVLTMDAFTGLHFAELIFAERTVGPEIDTPCPTVMVIDRHPNIYFFRFRSTLYGQPSPLNTDGIFITAL